MKNHYLKTARFPLAPVCGEPRRKNHRHLLAFLAASLLGLAPGHTQISYNYTFPSLGNWSITGGGNFTSAGCATTGSIYMSRSQSSLQGEMSSYIGESNGGTATLSYRYKIVNTSGGAATPANFGRFEVQFYNGLQSSWVTLQTIGVGGDAHVPSTACVQKTVQFTPVTGSVSLRLVSYWGSGAFNIHLDDVSVVQGAAPTAVPGCTTALNPVNGAANIKVLPVLSWAATPNANRYTLFYGTTPDTPSSISNIYTTSYAFPITLAANTTYYWKVVPRNNFGPATGCTVNSFQTGALPVYCLPTYETGCNDVDIISNVSLGTLSNASGCGGYVFYDNVTVPTLIQGQNANINLTVGNDSTQYLGAWIDFNQNGQFEPNEGIVTTTTTPGNTTQLLQLPVPANAVLGQTRLRVRGGDDVAMTTAQACGATNNRFGESEDYIVNIACASPGLWYADADADGFGNPAIQISACLQPVGYVANNLDCNDAVVYYEDLDGDGFGSSVKVACGTVTNDSDCNDSIVYYQDLDGDGFGSSVKVACGTVTNDSDCNDNIVYYQDLDGDGFGSSVKLACGTVTNNSDCNDNQLTYADLDNDGFGTGLPIACGTVTNNTDCNDANATVHQSYPFYVDADNDGFGFGSAVLVCAVNASTPPVGYANNDLDCNDAQVRYQDLDNDGFGSTVKVPCGGRTNNIDCNDNLLTYRDLDGDGYGVNILVACGAPNNTDCNDNNAAVFQSRLLYVDADGDGYTSGQSFVVCYGATLPPGFTLTNNGIDCQDNFAAINPGASEIAYNGIDDDCDGLIDEGYPQITTSLLPSSCGTTLASIGSLVGITTVSSAITGYRIKITNGAQVQIIEKNVPHFTFPQFPSYAYATTYTVEIELQRNGVWLGYYGPACLVSTPAILEEGGASSVSPSQCGITLSKINTLVATTSLAGVSGYRFRITNLTDAFGPNAIQTIDRTQNWFSLPMLTRYNYGTTYRVEVAVKTTGTYGGFGAPCEVSSPPPPDLINCGGTAASGTSTVAATSVSGATQYRFQITRAADLASATIDRSTNYFIFNSLPVLTFTPGGLYYIRVAVMTTGSWSPYGDVCEYTAPGGVSKGALSEGAATSFAFRATAHPNPFVTAFAIDLQTDYSDPVRIQVYDMLGKLIEDRSVNVAEPNLEQVGLQYPAGVYQVNVSQGAHVKTLRVIKR